MRRRPTSISGGNFHGQPLALALDLAAIAVAELANISERRVEQLVNPALSTGLTPFLAAGSGLHSGFMIAQVASASLVSENKVLCHPASVDSIPSSAGQGRPREHGERQRAEARAGRREREARAGDRDHDGGGGDRSAKTAAPEPRRGGGAGDGAGEGGPDDRGPARFTGTSRRWPRW